MAGRVTRSQNVTHDRHCQFAAAFPSHQQLEHTQHQPDTYSMLTVILGALLSTSGAFLKGTTVKPMYFRPRIKVSVLIKHEIGIWRTVLSDRGAVESVCSLWTFPLGAGHLLKIYSQKFFSAPGGVPPPLPCYPKF